MDRTTLTAISDRVNVRFGNTFPGPLHTMVRVQLGTLDIDYCNYIGH
jgi:hypothetical protein